MPSLKLRSYQKPIVKAALKAKTYAIFAEQRTGKTFVTLGVIDHLCDDDEQMFRGIIVCLGTNKNTTWATHAQNFIPGLIVVQTWEEFMERKNEPAPILLLLHYDQFRNKRLLPKIRKQRWTLIVVDESQRLKDRASLSSRALRRLRHNAEYKLVLSGTPIDSKPEELWGQFRFVKPDLFGDKWADFDAEYLKPSGYMGYKRTFRENKRKQFMDLIAPWSHRLEVEEAGILRPEVIDVPVKLGPRARRIYNTFERKSVVRFDGVRIRAGLAITRNVKLQQMTGGFVLDDDGDARTMSIAKLYATIALVKRRTGSVVVFCRYREEMLRVSEALSRRGHRVELLWGKVKDNKRGKFRTEMLQRFQNGEIDVLVAQIRTGGVGVDLWKAEFAIAYSVTYSFIDFDQAKMRLCHVDREDAPKVYCLRATDTVDDDIYPSLSEKADTNQAIMEGIRRRTKSY